MDQVVYRRKDASVKKNLYRIVYHTRSGARVEFSNGETALTGAELVDRLKSVTATLETGLAKEAEAEAAFADSAPTR